MHYFYHIISLVYIKIYNYKLRYLKILQLLITIIDLIRSISYYQKPFLSRGSKTKIVQKLRHAKFKIGRSNSEKAIKDLKKGHKY